MRSMRGGHEIATSGAELTSGNRMMRVTRSCRMVDPGDLRKVGLTGMRKCDIQYLPHQGFLRESVWSPRGQFETNRQVLSRKKMMDRIWSLCIYSTYQPLHIRALDLFRATASSDMWGGHPTATDSQRGVKLHAPGAYQKALIL